MIGQATCIEPQHPLIRRVQTAIKDYKQSGSKQALSARQVESRLKEYRDTLFLKHFPRSEVRKVFRGSFYGKWGLECGSGRVMVEMLPTGELKAMYRGDSVIINPLMGIEFERLVNFIRGYA